MEPRDGTVVPGEIGKAKTVGWLRVKVVAALQLL